METVINFKKEYTAARDLFDNADAQVKKELDANKAYQQARKIAFDPELPDDSAVMIEAMELACHYEIEAEKRYDRDTHQKRYYQARLAMVNAYFERVKKLSFCPKEIKEFYTPERLKETLYLKRGERLVELVMQDESW